jgi:hypothetical protein
LLLAFGSAGAYRFSSLVLDRAGWRAIQAWSPLPVRGPSLISLARGRSLFGAVTGTPGGAIQGNVRRLFREALVARPVMIRRGGFVGLPLVAEFLGSYFSARMSAALCCVLTAGIKLLGSTARIRADLSERALKSQQPRGTSKLMTRVRFPSPAPL